MRQGAALSREEAVSRAPRRAGAPSPVALPAQRGPEGRDRADMRQPAASPTRKGGETAG